MDEEKEYQDEACEVSEPKGLLKKRAYREPKGFRGSPDSYDAKNCWNYYAEVVEKPEDKSKSFEERTAIFKSWLIENQKKQIAEMTEEKMIEQAAKEAWKETKEETLKALGSEDPDRYADEGILDCGDYSGKPKEWLSEEVLKKYEADIEKAEKEQHDILQTCRTMHDVLPRGQQPWLVTQYRRLEEYKLVLTDIVIKNRYKLQTSGGFGGEDEPLSSEVRAKDMSYLREKLRRRDY